MASKETLKKSSKKLEPQQKKTVSWTVTTTVYGESDKDIEDRVKEITARLNREFGQAFANDEDDDLPIDEDEDEEEDEDDGELDFG